jgi:pimeloyl-ACP methyl ester carboxylesterase
MKKIIAYGLLTVAVIAVLLTAFYVLFPESVFKLAVDAQRRSAGLVKKEIQVEDHRIVYLEGGTGETIVLLHGFGGYKDQWTAFAKYMKGHHLVIPDIPGFGESSKLPSDDYGVERQVERIARFAGALNLDKFHVAGNSLGGAYAAAIAAKYPGRVLTLALLDTAGAPSPNKSKFVLQLEQGNNLLLASNPDEVEKLMDLAYAKPPGIPSAFRKILIADWIAHTEFNRKVWDDTHPFQLSLASVLPRIQAPVLILWGAQDNMLDVGGVEFLEKNLRHYRTIVMKDTGHCPMIERAEETAKVYMSFLQEKK